MSEADAFDLFQLAFWAMLKCAGPAVGAAMFVGVGVALFQALTQIQEMTLTFIPKIIAIFIAVAVTGSYAGQQILAFTQNVYGRIERGF